MATSSDIASSETNIRLLVLDDEASIRDAAKSVLGDFGYLVTTAASAAEALRLLSENPFEIVLCDMYLPGEDVIAFLDSLKSLDTRPAVIVMSAFATAEKALDAIRHGAYDYISKPFEIDDLVFTIRKAHERERLRSENEFLKEQVTRRYSFTNIIAESAGMLEIFETIKKIADYKTTVLISGASGTGKELIAKAIHYNSSRRSKRFVAINCGAIPENLLESELFGHKKGAFTDATRDKKGLFEEAQGGTIFLDEIGELPLHLQVKLLRVLQEGEIRPVGDTRIIPINVRVVAATLRDLEADILQGRFRDDLYYRLNVISIRIPPLRERREDVTLLIQYFLQRNQEKLGLAVYGVSREALSAMLDYDWPGNVRELENCIERAMILTEGSEITFESLPKSITAHSSTKSSSPIEHHGLPSDDLSIKSHTRVVEESLIRRALEKTGGNRTHAAKLLDISHRTLLYKLKDYGLE